MHTALSANDARALANGSSAAALPAVTDRIGVLREVILGQRSRRVGALACWLWLLLGRHLRQQLMHELFAEAQLTAMPLPFCCELTLETSVQVC